MFQWIKFSDVHFRIRIFGKYDFCACENCPYSKMVRICGPAAIRENRDFCHIQGIINTIKVKGIYNVYMYMHAWKNNYTDDVATSVTWFKHNLYTRYKMETRCCFLSSISVKIFQICQMSMHIKNLKQMTLSVWSRDLSTIYKPASKWRPDIVLQVSVPSNFVRSLCTIKKSHTCHQLVHITWVQFPDQMTYLWFYKG